MILMIDRLVQLFFRWGNLREAIFAEVHMYDGVAEALKEPTTNLTWCEEDGLWRGWYFNEMHKVYMFNDIGFKDLSDLWEDNWRWDSDMNLMYR